MGGAEATMPEGRLVADWLDLPPQRRDTMPRMRLGRSLAHRLDALVERIPAGRDRYIDFLRVMSIGVVIVWHWSLSILQWTDGRLAMPNPVDDVPGGWLATWLLQVVPIFFVVGGYVNGTAWWSSGDVGTFLVRRLQRLLVPLAVFVAVWAVAEVLLLLSLPGYPGVLNYGRVVFTPLWFIGAYVVVIALTPLTATMHRRSPWLALAVIVAIVLALDAGRFGLGIDAFAWVNIAMVWVAIHQLGYVVRDGLRPTNSPAGGIGTALLGLASLALMSGVGPYPRSMVSVPGQDFSNMYPTSAAILAVAVLQLGVMVIVRRPVTRWLERSSVYRPVIGINAVIMTVFVWHMTAVLIVMAAARGIGWEPLAEPTAAWWLQRPLWVLAPGVVLALFVRIFARFEVGGVLRR